MYEKNERYPVPDGKTRIRHSHGSISRREVTGAENQIG